MTFELHERLAAGGFDFGRHGGCRVLLKNNALYPWFIAVPEVDTGAVELHQLDGDAYGSLCQTTRTLSKFVSEHFACEKVNVGCIGNIVRQLHVHVVGRQPADPSWPGVVWGHSAKVAYEAARVEEIRKAYLAHTART